MGNGLGGAVDLREARTDASVRCTLSNTELAKLITKSLEHVSSYALVSPTEAAYPTLSKLDLHDAVLQEPAHVKIAPSEALGPSARCDPRFEAIIPRDSLQEIQR
jgi:hypothetical protein